jgi:glycosyltransferase involved in cell wall biosynthesis
MKPRSLRVAIVHYRDAAASGGSLRVGETIASHLDPARVSAEMVFAYGTAGPVANSVRVPCHFIGAKGPRDIAAWVSARALFKKIRPDVVHFQDGVVWLRMALLGTPSKKAVHVHGRYQKARKADNLNETPFRASTLLRTYLKSTDAQICINNGARDSLLNLGWISREKSYVVYNSIDLSRFSVKRDSGKARAQLDLPKDALLLGMVCRLVWEKGCGDLLSIIERLPSRWHGVICGEGPLRQQLEQECRTRRIADRIHFLGLQDDVVPVYAALDAYAFLSRYEPFGLVLAEAMASGVPIFGIEGDGEYKEAEYPLLSADTAELVAFDGSRYYETALPGQILDDIEDKISNYGEHPERYSQMIERARAWVGRCFAAPLQAEAMTRVYEHICRNSTRAPLELDGLYDATKQSAMRATSAVSPTGAGATITPHLAPNAAAV